MAFHPFPRLRAESFTQGADGVLTASAFALGIVAPSEPHGEARGINLTGTPHQGEPLDRVAFFLVEFGTWGWLYRDAINGREVRIGRGRTSRVWRA